MSILARALAAPVRLYQKTVSANTAPRCRYAPTCSNYAIEALHAHGAAKGTLLAMWRLARCNPWSKGGVDRVPPAGQWPRKPLNHTELMALYDAEDAAKAQGHEETHTNRGASRTRGD